MIRIDIAEIGFFAVVIRQGRVIHHLQQNIEKIRMGFFDFIEHQHGVRIAIDRVGQQTALIEADIARRRADQARYRVLFHVFAHVEAQELDAHGFGQLFGQLGLADACGTGKEKTTDRFFGMAQARSARA